MSLVGRLASRKPRAREWALNESDPAMGLARDVAFALGSALLTLGAVRFTPFGGPRTDTGRLKSRTERAFVLTVGLRFRDEASRDTLLTAWHEAADYCLANEPFL
eukprot:scaffold34702_cov37-Tisochrysis_lutea.AAC.1